MALDLAQQLAGTALAVGLGPVAGDEVAIEIRHHAGIGIDQDAAGRVVGAGEGIEGHEACPVVLPRPARHRHRAVALAPHRHARRRDQAGVPGGVGIDDVLHRRDDLACRGQELVPVLGEAEAGEAFSRRVGPVERGRLQRQHVARWREASGRKTSRVRIVGAAGNEIVDHHTMPGLAHAQRHGIAPPDVDRFVADRERPRAVGRDVAAGVGRVDALDEQILAVEVGGGEAPADRAVVAEHDRGRAGRGGAADVEAGADQAREIPDAREGERQMRIVGEQRLARYRVGARQHPFVGGLTLARGDIVGAAIEPVEVDALRRRADDRERRVRIVARRLDQEFHAGVADLLREPQAQQLGSPVAVEPERHQLGPDQRIGGPPLLGPIAAARQQLDEGEFEAVLLVVVGQPGVDAGGVGFEQGARAGRERVHAFARLPVDAEPAHGAVGVDQAAADHPWRDDLGQAPLAQAAHQLHLPEAVLGMDVAEAEGGILDGAGDDVRHGVLVAQDLDRGFQPGGLEVAAVGRQRAAYLEVGAGEEDQDREHRARQELQQASAEAKHDHRGDARTI